MNFFGSLVEFECICWNIDKRSDAILACTNQMYSICMIKNSLCVNQMKETEAKTDTDAKFGVQLHGQRPGDVFIQKS